MSPFYSPIHTTHYHLDQSLWRSHQLKKLLLLAAGFCFFAYLWQVNALSTTGFQIKTVEKKINNLKTEIQQLELTLASEKSINKINGRVQDLGMVRVDKVEYLRSLGSSVALGR